MNFLLVVFHFLEKHPKVNALHYIYTSKTLENYNTNIHFVCISELFAHVVNDAIIEFPSDDEWALDTLAKDLILLLLVLNPDERLGFNGPHEVKQHPYLDSMDWDSLLRYKAEFIPQLDNDEDTSYFDTRTDRYNHEFEDTDTDDSPILSSK
jgi:microtubule-associated serine/threonine kinase